MSTQQSAAEPAAQAGRSPVYRELGVVIAAIVIGAGGVLLLTSMVWLRLNGTRPAPFPPVTAAIKGRTEFPALAGLAIVALLIAVLALVTGKWARRALGILLVGAGAWCLVYAVKGLSVPGTGRQVELLTGQSSQYGFIRAHAEPGLAAVTVVLSVILIFAGLVLAIRSKRWSGGLSAKYSAPVEARRSDDPWRSLDRGEDPTVSGS